MGKTDTKLLTTIVIRIAINYPGTPITVSTKVLLLSGHIGSLLVCMLFGWKYGIVIAFLLSAMNQILFGPFAPPFVPTGMLMIFMVGISYEKGYFRKLHTIPALPLAILPGTILSAIIQGYTFGGATGSGSDVIIRFMINKGVNPATISFINQYFMEFIGRLISFTVVMTAIKRIKIESIR